MNRSQGICWHFVLGLSVLLLLGQTGWAQSDRASIVGTVTDTSGAAVSGATVTVTNTQTNVSRDSTTDENGRYIFPAILEVGTYKVSVKAEGFQPVETEELVLQVNDARSVNIQLTPGQVSDVITVTAEAPLVKTESSELGEVVDTRKVTDLPLNGRNYTQLATLVPGVVRPTGFGGSNALIGGGTGGTSGNGAPGPRTEGARFDSSGGSEISANGQRPAFNNFLVDGIDNNEPLFGQIGVYSNPDAIGEFKVITGTPPAEFGRSGGAVITSSFKSGGNELHGTGYYFHRNKVLNARAFGNPKTTDSGIPIDKEQFRNHEFGFSVGGPVFRDKTFFFFDYAGQRNNKPQSGTTTVPTALSRRGDFSEFVTAGFAVPVDPQTGQPFRGGIIPMNRILAGGGQASLNALNAYDLPNQGGVTNNFTFTRDILEKINSFDARGDHNFNAANHLFGRVTYANQRRQRDSIFSKAPAGFGNGVEFGNTRQVVIGDTHIFSPTLINDFRFGYSKIDISIIEGGVGGALGLSPTFAQDLGIPGINDGRFETSGAPGLGFNSGPGSVEFIGDGGPFTVPSKNYSVSDSLTIVKGRHSFKAGGSITHRRSQQFDGGRSGGVKGFFGIGGGFGGTNDAGNVQANVLLGIGQAFLQRGFVNGPFLQISNELGFFVQDDFRVNDRLVLNLGLRYDYYGNPVEDQDRQGNFDPQTRTILVAGVDGSRQLIRKDKNNFGPHIGFAYALGEKRNMVVRGGYALMYGLENPGIPNLTQNPPASQPTQFFPNDPNINLKNGFPALTGMLNPKNLPGDRAYVYIDPRRRDPYIQQFQVSFQYEFIKNYVFNIAYVGNQGRKLLASRQLGSNANGANQFAGTGSLPTLTNVQALENRAASNYNSLQMSLNKRFSDGISFLLSYAYAHAIDDSSGPDAKFQNSGGGNLNGPQDPSNLAGERANSNFDVRHTFSGSVVYDLPIGRGRRYLGNVDKTVDKLIGGWQVNLISTIRSGLPYTILASNGFSRPELVGDPEGQGGFEFNLNAFRAPNTVLRGNRLLLVGSTARNLLHGPEFVNFDISLFKSVPIEAISENFKVQMRFEFFNIFNRTNLGNPNASLNFDSAGRVIDDGTVGRSTFASSKRQIQVAVKLIF
ncbi:MAG: TonB-dependent receptor [Acidobacteriota bacterium]